LSSSILDFLSRHCKVNEHDDCFGRWQGLGLEIYCYCKCHDKKGDALTEVHEPETNAINRMQPHISIARGEISD
jgi:hypothetical protein